MEASPVSMAIGWESWKRETDALMRHKVEEDMASLQHEDVHLRMVLQVGSPQGFMARPAISEPIGW